MIQKLDALNSRAILLFTHNITMLAADGNLNVGATMYVNGPVTPLTD